MAESTAFSDPQAPSSALTTLGLLDSWSCYLIIMYMYVSTHTRVGVLK